MIELTSIHLISTALLGTHSVVIIHFQLVLAKPELSGDASPNFPYKIDRVTSNEFQQHNLDLT